MRCTKTCIEGLAYGAELLENIFFGLILVEYGNLSAPFHLTSLGLKIFFGSVFSLAAGRSGNTLAGYCVYNFRHT